MPRKRATAGFVGQQTNQVYATHNYYTQAAKWLFNMNRLQAAIAVNSDSRRPHCERPRSCECRGFETAAVCKSTLARLALEHEQLPSFTPSPRTHSLFSPLRRMLFHTRHVRISERNAGRRLLTSTFEQAVSFVGTSNQKPPMISQIGRPPYIYYRAHTFLCTSIDRL